MVVCWFSVVMVVVVVELVVGWWLFGGVGDSDGQNGGCS